MKVYLLRKSTREIVEAVRSKLAVDTNTLIDISSRDACMRELTAELNTQLRLLREERLRYQQGNREIKDAVTGISHDLRTPLTAIKGYLDLAEQEEQGTTTQRYLSCIKERTKTLETLTEEMLLYSVAASSHELKLEHVNLIGTLEKSLLSFYGAMRERGVEPQIELPEEPVFRQLDSAALDRIFSNIIGNALKYSDGHFSITANTKGRIVFSNAAPNLNAASANKLFCRFYTAEPGRTSTGLGLAIAKDLTECMGGQVSAACHEGILDITLCFPAKSIPQSRSTSTASSAK